MSQNARKAASLFVIVILVAGCGGGQQTAKVSGKVRFQGQPIAQGQVKFLADDGRLAVGAVSNGEYVIANAPVGPVKVAVTSIAPGPKFVKPGDPTPPPETAPTPGAYVALPERYADPEKSQLKYTVQGASNEVHDLELVP